MKSQIGHTKCAAGVVGLIKIARAVYHRVLPPTLHVEHPHPDWDRATSPFRFLTSSQPWVGATRRAAVSAFGFGGANFHAVISSVPDSPSAEHGVAVWPAELVLVRGETSAEARSHAAALATMARRVAAEDPEGVRHRLRDLAFTVSVGGGAAASTSPVQMAVVAHDWGDLATKLEAAVDGEERGDHVHRSSGDETLGRVAFVYPGQGSQRPGMLGDLFVAFPWLGEVLEAGQPWLSIMFPPSPRGTDEKAAQLKEITATDNAQPTLGLAEAALGRLWARLGLTPHAAAGHSYGELPALAGAGCFDLSTLLTLSRGRAEAMSQAAKANGADPGAMAAVSLAAADVEERLNAEAGVVVANENGPRQSVISGPTEAVRAACEELQRQGVGVRALGVACAFHSPMMSAATDPMLAHLHQAAISPPRVTVVSCASGKPYPADVDSLKALLAAGIAAPVRWVDQVESLYQLGVRTFVEVGPGRVLTSLIGSILKGRPHT
ncbi:MAG: acyltransferase domain-containing protein, partial [Acidimicrobiales bacterium]